MNNRPYKTNRYASRRRTTGHRPAKRGSSKTAAHGVETLNVGMLLVSMIASVPMGLVCMLLYRILVNSAPRALLIGILFGVFSLGMGIVIFIYSHLSSSYSEDVLCGSPLLTIGGMIAVGAVLVCLGTLFQWIYGLNFVEEDTTATSYIFVIDDSGSMEGNDPDYIRYKSILDVMETMPDDFPYMVYRFTNRAEVLREMDPVKEGESFVGVSEGGTDIKNALTTVMNDRESGVWDGGRYPKVILLTDGNSSGFYGSILKRYATEKISVSTVGFGSANDSLLSDIAEKTGGVYVGVDSIDQLATAIEQAVTTVAARDLVTARPATSMSFVYGLLRVLFLTILGAGVAVLGMLAYGRSDCAETILVFGAGMAFVGSLLMEVGTDCGISDGIMRLCMWVLFGTFVGTVQSVKTNGRVLDKGNEWKGKERNGALSQL